MKFVKGLLLVFFLYAFLHNPLLTPLGGTGLCKILYFFAILYILVDYKSFIQTCSVFRKELFLIALLIGFVLFRTVIGGEPVILYQNIILFIESFIIPIVFVSYWVKNNYSSELLVRFVLIVSSIAAIISVACIVLPSFGTYVRFELQASSDYILEHEFRGFGVSDSLTSSFGYIQGACFAIAFKYLKTNKWVLFFMPFILFSAVINARTGVIIAIVGLLIVLFTQKHFMKSSIYLALLTLLFIQIVPFFINWVNPSDRTVDFIVEFWDQMQDIDNNSTVGALNSSIIYPSNIYEWTFGKGVDLFGQPSGRRSDIGYIIQLNYGGIFYIAILFGLLLYMFIRLIKLHHDSFYPLFFVLSLSILNYKANILSNTGYFRFVMLLYFLIIMINHPKELVKKRIKYE